MRRLRPFLAVCLFGLVTAIGTSAARAAAAEEIGRPVLRHYTPGEHLRGINSPRVFQDASGVVLFANHVDLLRFDGLRWDLVELPTESLAARQFAVTDDGTIYVAGGQVLGFLRGHGLTTGFTSLVERLPADARNLAELRSAVALGSVVYFSDAEKILRWDGARFAVIPYASPPEAHGARLHRVGPAVYVTALGHPLGRLAGEQVELVADDPLFREQQIISIEPAAAGELLCLTAEQGFFHLSAAGRVAPFPTEMDHWLAGKRVYCARRLADGSRVFGFSAMSGDGGLRFDPSGRYVGPLDTTIGLVVKTVRDFSPDREGGLWLGMDQGAARLEWPSPVSVFDAVNGLGQGAVTDVARRDGVLYATTSEGFFRLVPTDSSGRGARFERLPNARGLGDLFDRTESAPPSEDDMRLLPHFALATIGRISRVRTETGPDGPVRWYCGASGLARLAGVTPPAAPVPFAVLLEASGVSPGAQLPTRPPPVVFNYLAPRQRPTSPVSYQTRLTGFEDEWSDWSARRDRTFANLPSGDYRFEVRARDAAGVSAAPAALAFNVLAPWWRSRWALAGYGLAGLGLIAGIVRIRTHTLHQRAERLEDLVSQRTEELARKNAELIRLNQLELDEKITARLAEEKARLEVLRYQLNPHFLFNTLTSISATLPAGTSTPRTMVERLAEFCRLTLHRSDDRDWTTVGEEVQLLRAYLEIEQSRWGALLDVEITCDAALLTDALPHFLLLPLVENALKYGRATSAERVGLRLTAARGEDGALVFTVANTGEWIEPATKKTVSTLGIGLENLRERLARHYPRAHALTFAHGDGWVTVVLRISPRPTSS